MVEIGVELGYGVVGRLGWDCGGDAAGYVMVWGGGRLLGVRRSKSTGSGGVRGGAYTLDTKGAPGGWGFVAMGICGLCFEWEVRGWGCVWTLLLFLREGEEEIGREGRVVAGA